MLSSLNPQSGQSPASVSSPLLTTPKAGASATPSVNMGLSNTPAAPLLANTPADFSSASALKASVSLRFAGQSDEAEATRLMADVLPRLADEATDWQMVQLYGEGGGMSSGSEMTCQMGDTRYTLREIFGDELAIERGDYVQVDSPRGRKTYRFEPRPDYRSAESFVTIRRAFYDAGQPQVTARRIQNILDNQAGFELESYVHNGDSGQMYFNIDGRRYYIPMQNELAWMYEGQQVDEAVVRQDWERHVAKLTDINASREEFQRWPIPTFEAHLKSYKRQHQDTSRITPAQQQQVHLALKGRISAALSEAYGFGDNLNPRPFLENVARDLLADPLNGNVRYRVDLAGVDDDDLEKGTAKVVWDTGRQNENWRYVELTRHRNDDNGDFTYFINSREGEPSVMLQVRAPEDVALVEKMLTVLKTMDTSHGGNWHISLMEGMDRLQRGASSVEEEVAGVLPQVDRSVPDVSEKPAYKLKATAALLDELEEMLGH